jgi:hypothetical protein
MSQPINPLQAIFSHQPQPAPPKVVKPTPIAPPKEQGPLNPLLLLKNSNPKDNVKPSTFIAFQKKEESILTKSTNNLDKLNSEKYDL